uniref:Lysosome-associated membrane glycoprotein 1 n=1 Tax=Fundulus heteroclitus TaxID=8078 RepID=A0A3Q2PIG4_FUNHE
MIAAGGQSRGVVGAMLPLVLAAVLHQSLATVAPPTPAQTTAAPHKDPGRPERGTYNVTNANNTVCLLAYMGLQLNLTYNATSQNTAVQEVVNIKPNVTLASGSCEAERAVLELKTDANATVLTFVFTLNSTSSKYHLSEVSLTTTVPDLKGGKFSARNSSLDFLQGSLQYSYMCRTEQTLTVTQNLSINTFQVQLQPFGVTGDKFGAAVECQLDEDDMLIPIIVGAALAGLVLVVLLAYLIGRKRSHAGYQTI